MDGTDKPGRVIFRVGQLTGPDPVWIAYRERVTPGGPSVWRLGLFDPANSADPIETLPALVARNPSRDDVVDYLSQRLPVAAAEAICDKWEARGAK